MSSLPRPPASLQSQLGAASQLLGRHPAAPLPFSTSPKTDNSSNDSSDDGPPSPSIRRSAVPSPQIHRRTSPPPLQRRRLTPSPSVLPSAHTHDGSMGSFQDGLRRSSPRSPSCGERGWQLMEGDDVEMKKDSADVTDEVEIGADSWLMKVVPNSLEDEEEEVVSDSRLMKIVPDSLENDEEEVVSAMTKIVPDSLDDEEEEVASAMMKIMPDSMQNEEDGRAKGKEEVKRTPAAVTKWRGPLEKLLECSNMATLF